MDDLFANHARIRPGEAERGDRDDDLVGELATQFGRIGHRLGLDDDVGPPDQPVERFGAAVEQPVEHDGTLVGVQVEVERRGLGVSGLGRERAEVASPIASARFDLHDIGAVPCEELGAVGAGDPFSEFEDPNPCERLMHTGKLAGGFR